jgi:hypothetical protein
MEGNSFRDSMSDAIRYWELRRIAYNAILAAVVLIYFALDYPASKAALTVDRALVIFMLAVLANVAYCAAYIPDIVAQLSGYRETWRRYRWTVFVIEILFAGIITRFWAMGLFSPIY